MSTTQPTPQIPGTLIPSETEPVFYHELPRAEARFSRPRTFWVTVLAFAFWQFLQFTVVGIWLGIDIMRSALPQTGGAQTLTESDLQSILERAAERLIALSPRDSVLFVIFMVTAALVPVLVWLATLITKVPVFKYLSSVTGRLRWSLILEAVIPAIAATGSMFALSLFLLGSQIEFTHISTPKLVVGVLTILLLVPLQAAGEEYFFRGLLTQWVGSIFRHPAWAILVPALLFGWVHGYNGWATACIVLMGAVLGYLTLRSGGIEMAIVFHAVNNWFAFGYSLATGDTTPQNGQHATIADFVSTAVVLAIFVIWAEWRLHRKERVLVTSLTRPIDA